MKFIRALPFLFSAAGLWAQTAAPINENNLPSTSTLSDNDAVRVIKNGQSMKTPAGVVRTIRAAQISDASGVGRNWITTATPTSIVYPRVNANGTITYLDANAFLAAIGAGSASVSIREIDGNPDMPFNVLEVTDGTITDLGGGVARLTIGSGSGGGGTWGSITGTLSSQTDLQAALDAKQPLDSDLTSIAALTTTTYGRSLLTVTDSAAALTLLGAQASNSNLDDLADGSLTGSKVGTGINAANITSGTLALARGGLARDASADSSGLFGILAGASTDVDTIGEFSTALGVTGTPSSTTVLRGDGVWTTAPGSITVREEDSSPSVSTVTEIRVTNGGLIDNGSGSVSLDLSGGGGGGDTTSTVSTSVDNEIVLYSGTSGKQIKRASSTGILNATAGVIGTVTNSAGLAAGLSDETGTGAAVFASGPTFITPQLGAASASSLTSPIFQSNAGDPADTGIFRLANNELISWENNPASTDNTLGVNTSNVLTANGTFSAVTLQEGGVAVPNSTDNLSFFSATSSAQLASVLADEVGTGRFVLDTNATLTTPTVSGNLSYLNGYQYADAAMAALVIDTAELNNTKSISADSTFTFSGAPATGAIFGMQLTNTDVAVHTITIPSSNSDALGGAARTTFLLGPGSSTTLKWRYEGGSSYTMWGDPFSINELTVDSSPSPTDDYVMTYSASAGVHKKVVLNLLPAGSGDAISVDSVSVVDPNFTDGGDINFASTGSPATVTATVKADSVALSTDTTGNYVASITPGLGLTGTTNTEAGANTVAFDESAALSGDHTLSADQEKFGVSGLIWEGLTANAIETYFSITDPTSSDKTITFPDSSGTVILSGHTFTGNVTGTLGTGGTTALTITGNAVNGADIAMGSDAQGDILYYDGTDYARLGAGTSGQVLQTNGVGANPSWATPGSGSTSSSSFTVTGSENVVLSNGAWAAGWAVPYFRPTDANTPMAFDVMPNGTLASGQDSHIDICSTDITADAANFEALELKLLSPASGVPYGHIGTKKLGTGTVRPLAINENGADVIIGSVPGGAINAALLITDATDQSALTLMNSVAAGYTRMIYNATGRAFTTGVGNASETALTLANKFFIMDQTSGTVRLTLDSAGLFTFTGTGSFSGNLAVPTATAGDSDTSAASTAFVQTEVDATQTSTHASPATGTQSPTWSGPMHTVWCGATMTVNLPAAASYTGRGILIYNTGAFTLTIEPNGSEVIVRAGTAQTGGVNFTLASGAGNFVALISDGVRWITLGTVGTLTVGT